MQRAKQLLLRILPMLLLGGFSFALRLWTLNKSAFAPGWDSYFYLVQVKSLAETGTMHSPDSSPIFGLLYGLSQICGDYILAYKLLSAGLAGLFTSLSFLLARKIGGFGPALVVASWTIFSPSLTFFAAQFPKNLLGLNGLLLLLYALHNQGRWPKILAFSFAFVAHRMTAGLALLFLLFQQFTWRRMRLLFSLASLGLLASFLLPGLLHLSDFQRLQGALSSLPQLPGYAFIQLMDAARMHWLWIAEIALAYLFFAVLLHHIWQQKPDRWLLGFVLLLSLLTFPFLIIDENGIGYRFFLTFMLLAPLCFACIPHVLPRQFFYFAAGLALGMTLPAQAAYAPETFDPDYARYTQIARKTAALLQAQQTELLIAHKGLAELMTFETGLDVLPWQPEYAIDSTRLWRISFGLQNMEFRYLLSAKDARQVRELGLEYHLLPEAVWQRFRQAAAQEPDADLQARIKSWQNPSRMRPAYLRRNRAQP
ncbi:MAG TPA: hypothetical protein ENJ82_05230 [Bacteroidetes bacterium]|nr:hypothetical protein [Bacteroidota bacterium]